MEIVIVGPLSQMVQTSANMPTVVNQSTLVLILVALARLVYIII